MLVKFMEILVSQLGRKPGRQPGRKIFSQVICPGAPWYSAATAALCWWAEEKATEIHRSCRR